MRASALRLVVVCLLALPAAAQTTFDLRTSDPYPEGTIEDLDENASFTITKDGIAATLTANDGVLNQTGSGFGVNAAASGDDTDNLDDGSGVIESVTVSFDADVLLDEIGLSALGASDSGTVVIAGGTPQVLNMSTTTFSSGNLITAGQTFVVTYSTGNGFSFDDFTISTPSAAVPASGAVAWIALPALLAAAGALALRRRR